MPTFRDVGGAASGGICGNLLTALTTLLATPRVWFTAIFGTELLMFGTELLILNILARLL